MKQSIHITFTNNFKIKFNTMNGTPIHLLNKKKLFYRNIVCEKCYLDIIIQLKFITNWINTGLKTG